MSKSKHPVRLNQQVKSLFLKHSGRFYAKMFESKSKYMRILIISKGFLLAAQNNQLYTLELKRSNDDPKIFAFKLMKPGENYRYFVTLKVSGDGLCKLNKLLKFPHVKAEFQFLTPKEDADEFMVLFEEHLSQAKLAFYFNDNSPPSFDHSISVLISKFYQRINEIRCKASLLKCEPMNLDVCQAINVESFDHLKEILTIHKIKNMELNYMNKFNSTISPSYFDNFPTCPRLQKLEFQHYPWGRDYDVFKNLQKMLQYFSNLQEFIFMFSDSNERLSDPLNSRQLMELAAKLAKTIEKFQQDYKTSVKVKLDCVVSSVRFDESQQVVEESFEYLKSISPKFKHSKIGPYETANKSYSIHTKWKEDNFEVNFTIGLKLTSFWVFQ